jgi:hypothetical protein
MENQGKLMEMAENGILMNVCEIDIDRYTVDSR